MQLSSMVVAHTKEGRVMSAYEEFKWMIKYLDELDVVNAKIVEGLGRCGPRNISLVAKAIHLPITTVGFRLRKLITNGFLQLNALLDYSKLNLTRAVLIAENFRGNEELLWKAIDNVGYWTYISRCYGKYNGLYALFGFPIRYKEELQSYFAEAANLQVVSQTCFFGRRIL
jgi:DNA-binding Lrp family transcriptional regulator